MDPFLILVCAALLGIIPAALVSDKGQNVVIWWLFGVVLFPITLICAILLPKPVPAAAPLTRRCRFCDEFIQDRAVVCRYCGRDLSIAESSRQSQ
jgi:hypothetical protein